MEDRKLMAKLILVLLLGVGLLIGGCSQLNQNDEGLSSPGITAPAPEDNPSRSADGFSGGGMGSDGALPPMNLTHYQYPPEASLPPEGTEFIPLGSSNPVISSNGSWAVTYIVEEKGGELWLNGSGIVIEPYGVPYSTWIGMTEPVPTAPWIEFEPHGLQFTSPQYARISYKGCEFPEEINPESLQVYYWDDVTEQYECIGGENNLDEQYIEFDIEHFSRYVVAGDD